MKILMVCLGNICRSPLAEGILQHKINAKGLDWKVQSAGTAAYHSGDLPDPRSIEIARQHGVDITKQRAQKIETSDLDEYDLVLTMDQANYRNVLALANTDAQKKKVRPIMEFANGQHPKSVPDPYWDDDGFLKVYQMLDDATEGILAAFE